MHCRGRSAWWRVLGWAGVPSWRPCPASHRRGVGQGGVAVRWRAIGLRLTRAAVQAACSRALARADVAALAGAVAVRRAGRGAARSAAGCGAGARRCRGRRALGGRRSAALRRGLMRIWLARRVRADAALAQRAAAQMPLGEARAARTGRSVRIGAVWPAGQVTVPASRSIWKSRLPSRPSRPVPSGTGASTSTSRSASSARTGPLP